MNNNNCLAVFKDNLKLSSKDYTSDPQIWLTRSTLMQSLAPTLIKLTYLWFSNDPEDID